MLCHIKLKTKNNDIKVATLLTRVKVNSFVCLYICFCFKKETKTHLFLTKINHIH